MISLFGDEIPDVPPAPQTPKKSGHAAAPGTGPKGETCRTCAFYTLKGRYRKCAKARAGWTHGPGSDIRAKDAACFFWKNAKDQDHEGGEHAARTR